MARRYLYKVLYWLRVSLERMIVSSSSVTLL